MLVKCQTCGKLIDRNIAYKVEIGGANKYFCSKQEYDEEKARKDKTKEILEVITECYQYCTGYGEPPYSFVKKELKENLGAIDIGKIYQFVKENREKLKRTFVKKIVREGPFSQIYFAFRYISGIIKREILEKNWKGSQVAPVVPKTGIYFDLYEKPKNIEQRRISLNELEDMVEDVQ